MGCIECLYVLVYLIVCMCVCDCCVAPCAAILDPRMVVCVSWGAACNSVNRCRVAEEENVWVACEVCG